MISFTISKTASRTLNHVSVATTKWTEQKLQTITSHLPDLTMVSSEPACNKTRWGNIPMLTPANYNEWKADMIHILSAMRAYAIVTGEDPEP
jgi:hypothetical protein